MAAGERIALEFAEEAIKGLLQNIAKAFDGDQVARRRVAEIMPYSRSEAERKIDEAIIASKPRGTPR